MMPVIEASERVTWTAECDILSSNSVSSSLFLVSNESTCSIEVLINKPSFNHRCGTVMQNSTEVCTNPHNFEKQVESFF